MAGAAERWVGPAEQELEHTPAVAAGAESAIDIDAAIAQLQCREHLIQHHGAMPDVSW